MDFNSIMTGVTLLVLGALFLWRWRLSRGTARLIGQPVPDTSTVDGHVPASGRVFYFFNEHCRVCRAIAPLVDEMAEEHPNLIRVDVAEHMELATQFSVMGTPTFVAVGDGLIRDIKIGAPSRVWLTAYLEHQ